MKIKHENLNKLISNKLNGYFLFNSRKYSIHNAMKAIILFRKYVRNILT